MSIDYSAATAEVDVHALLLDTGMFVQGSDPNPNSHCYVPPSGGVGFGVPQNATQAFAAAEDPLVSRAVPSSPYSKDFTGQRLRRPGHAIVPRGARDQHEQQDERPAAGQAHSRRDPGQEERAECAQGHASGLALPVHHAGRRHHAAGAAAMRL